MWSTHYGCLLYCLLSPLCLWTEPPPSYLMITRFGCSCCCWESVGSSQHRVEDCNVSWTCGQSILMAVISLRHARSDAGYSRADILLTLIVVLAHEGWKKHFHNPLFIATLKWGNASDWSEDVVLCLWWMFAIITHVFQSVLENVNINKHKLSIFLLAYLLNNL